MIKRPLQVSHAFLAEVLDKEAIAVDLSLIHISAPTRQEAIS